MEAKIGHEKVVFGSLFEFTMAARSVGGPGGAAGPGLAPKQA